MTWWRVTQVVAVVIEAPDKETAIAEAERSVYYWKDWRVVDPGGIEATPIKEGDKP